MKKAELIFNLVSIPVDAAFLLMAGLASFYLRQHSVEIVGPIKFQLDLSMFLNFVYEFIPLMLLIFASLGLYNLRGTRKFANEFGKIIIGVSLGLLVVVLVFFLTKAFSSPVLLFWPVGGWALFL